MKIIPIIKFCNDRQKKDRYARIILNKIIREEQRRKVIQLSTNSNNSQLLDIIV